MEGLLFTPLLLAGKVESPRIIKRKTDLCVPENQSTKLQGKLWTAVRARSKTSSKIIKNHQKSLFSEPFKSPQPLNPRGEQVDRSALHVRHGVYYTYVCQGERRDCLSKLSKVKNHQKSRKIIHYSLFLARKATKNSG